MFELNGDVILEIREVKTKYQTAIVRTFRAKALNIHATYESGVLTAEFRRPVIEGTEWNGQVVEDSRPMYYSVDGGNPVEFSGSASITLDSGNHRILVAAPGCDPVEIEVSIPAT